MSTSSTLDNEIDSKNYTANTPSAMSLAMMAFLGIATFNAGQLLLLVLITFKRYSGLYFWSVLTAAGGIPMYCVGFVLKFFVGKNVTNMNYIGTAVVTLGWVPMVTGQSLALYSRLNLVIHDHRKLRWILYMILVDAFIFHGTTSVFGLAGEASMKMAKIYFIFEKMELVAFSIQEIIISSLYIYETYRFLRPTNAAQEKGIIAVKKNLIYVNLVAICLDVSLISIEMAGQYKIQTTFKALVYSVKLGLEFSVLNTLRRATKGPRGRISNDSRYARSYRSGNTMESFRGTQKTSTGNTEHPISFSSVSKGESAGMWEMTDANIMKTTEVCVRLSAVGEIGTGSGKQEEHGAASNSISNVP